MTHGGGFPLHPLGRRTLGPRRDSGTSEIAAWRELDGANAAEEVRMLGARLERGDETLSLVETAPFSSRGGVSLGCDGNTWP
jgi:hypothetical protein